MIQMTSGVYGTKHGMKRSNDGPFSLSAAEEARLVDRGVAKYVGDPVLQDEPAAGGKPLDEMSLAELRALGKEYGLSFRVGMTKAAMANAIRAAEQPDAEEEDAGSESDVDPVDQEGVEEEGTADLDDEEGDAADEEAPTFDPTQAVQ